MKAFLDFETRSPVNLLTDGAHKYAEQAEIICLAYAFDDAPVRLWTPDKPFPPALDEHIQNDGECCAHNAEFEYVIFNHCLPDHAPEDYQWTCTAAMARACALPGKLELVARALGTNAQKDKRGAELIKLLCIPPYNEDPALLEEMYAYCIQDVETERQVHHCLRAFSDAEHEDFLTNLVINTRGIPVDTELAQLACSYATQEKDALTQRLADITLGELTKTSGTGLTAWVYNRLPFDQQALMERNGKRTLDKRTRFELLQHPDLDSFTREVIELCDGASRSSVAKYQAILHNAQDDHRVRGAYLFNGAGQTGRYSSSGLQAHNLPRASMPDPDAVIADMRQHRPLDDCLETLSHMLRPAIKAPTGKTLVWADWSAIEGRVLPWLARDLVADNKLHLFKTGQDIYVHTAAEMFNTGIDDIDKETRQVGKVAELSLGYGGGVGALKAMGRNYGVHFEDTEAERHKTRWREVNRWAPLFWHALEAAATRAVRHPGTDQPCGRLVYHYTPDVLHGALWCTLPSGRPICYPSCRFEMVEDRRTITAMKASLQPKRGEKEWPRMSLWGGLLAQGATQATAADLLRHALRKLVVGMDAPVVLHTHDEITLEVSTDQRDYWLKQLTKVMTTNPAWAEGLPLAAEGDSGERYGK